MDGVSTLSVHASCLNCTALGEGSHGFGGSPKKKFKRAVWQQYNVRFWGGWNGGEKGIQRVPMALQKPRLRRQYLVDGLIVVRPLVLGVSNRAWG